jgi:Cu(I)/Ag(I) efflux system membrane fusion protein
MKKYFLVMAVGAFFLAACGLNKTKDQAAESPEVEVTTDEVVAQGEQVVLSVQGICEQCKERIEKAATEVPGVFSAVWDSETKELHLNIDPSQTDLDVISKAVAAAGNDTEKDKADDAVYDALGCCKYR